MSIKHGINKCSYGITHKISLFASFLQYPLIVVSLRVPAVSVGRMCWLGKINKSFLNFLCVCCCDRNHKIKLYVLFLAVWIRILLILCCVQSAYYVSSFLNHLTKSVIKLPYMPCFWGVNEKSFSFALSSLCTVFINYLLVSVIKLGCLSQRF